jgi:predicted nucleic acid-binding protein
MILFCDTSALVKLYVQEEGSELMLEVAREATVVAVCRIAWAEAMSAFARRSREAPEETLLLNQVRGRFQQDWVSFATVEVTQQLVEQAGEYAEIFALHAYDSIQLAAAQTLQQAGSEKVSFGCFDQRLQKAAQLLGLFPIPFATLNQPAS